MRFFTIEDKGGKEKGRRKEGAGGAPNGRVNGEAKKKDRDDDLPRTDGMEERRRRGGWKGGGGA